jgi:hypothetical protein
MGVQLVDASARTVPGAIPFDEPESQDTVRRTAALLSRSPTHVPRTISHSLCSVLPLAPFQGATISVGGKELANWHTGTAVSRK